MIKLHGFPVSNYVNMVNLALLEKGLPFEYVLTIPDQTEATLTRSPRGKVPFVETEHGFINEASVILEYFEERGEGKALLPKDPGQRAFVRMLMKELELYIELPARSCFGEAFFGVTLPGAIKAKARDELTAGFAALKRHGKFSPYLAGDQFTLADITFLYSVDLANAVAMKLFDCDFLAGLPAAKALLERLGENPNVRAIAEKREAARAGFIAAMQAKLNPAAK